jgi:hypothetical protein
MSNRFLISVAAAALIAGTSFANAQGMSKDSPGAAGGGAATQHSAPAGGASSGGAMEHDSGGMKSENGAMKGAEQNKGAASGMKAESNDKSGAAKDMKAEGRDKNGTMNAEKSGAAPQTNQNAQTKSPNDTNRAQTNERSQTTTGNAATTATAAPPAEKRTQISTAIRSEHVTEVTNVNFNVSVGTRIPADVHFYPVPERVVTIYPEWRGYDFILVGGRYLIVQPETHEIVYIIEG